MIITISGILTFIFFACKLFSKTENTDRIYTEQEKCED